MRTVRIAETGTTAARTRVVLRTTVLALAVVAVTGCQRSLFKESEPRTQFETYDRMRQRFVPKQELDVFGKPKPALRARLSRGAPS